MKEKTKCVGPECDRKSKARGLCMGHYHQWRAGKPLKPLRRYMVLDTYQGKRVCTKCLVMKPLDMFYKRSNGSVRSWCKACQIDAATKNKAERDARARSTA